MKSIKLRTKRRVPPTSNNRRTTSTKVLPIPLAAYSPGIFTKNLYDLKPHAMFL